MRNRSQVYLLLSFSLLASATVNAQQSLDLKTLFTTDQERQIINANRYKKDNKQVSKQSPAETVAVRELVKEKVTRSYKISGISISVDGSRVAWVNNRAYEHGDALDDGSRININNGTIKSVSITTPDGKKHTATSGETLAVSYLRAQQE